MQAHRRCICYSRQVRHDYSAAGVFVRRYRSPDDWVDSIGNAERRAGERAADAAIHLEAIESLSRTPRCDRADPNAAGAKPNPRSKPVIRVELTNELR